MKYYTPLRYPGGKSRLSNFMRYIFLVNNLVGGVYVEPYAGGAGIAFQLLFNGYASHIHINDLNKSVYSFWFSVINDTDNLCRLINDTPVDVQTWKTQNEIQKRPCDNTPLELGFSTFFLNRTNYSGILNGGMVGGKNQEGTWKLDARYNKENLISRIEKISRYGDQISVYNIDASKFIKSVIPKLPYSSLIYFDPPYYKKGSNLYENYYNYKDHEKISNLVKEIEYKWIVSYDNVQQIKEMYRQYRSMTYNLSYSAGTHHDGSEIMFFSNNLKIPVKGNPASIVSESK